jgi:hypothetical protein
MELKRRFLAKIAALKEKRRCRGAHRCALAHGFSILKLAF